MRFELGVTARHEDEETFIGRSRTLQFARGTGMVGVVWQTGQSLWVADTMTDSRVSRPDLAREVHLRSALLFPVVFEHRIVGVVSISSDMIREPDERLRRTMELVGSQIGQFVQHKQAEADLRASEARFRSLTALSSDWYWEQDENLRFTYLSSQASGLSGYPVESTIGKTRSEIPNTTPLTATWAEHQAVLAARRPFRDLECSRVAPDGTLLYISMSGEPLFDEQGRFKGYHGTGRNITERKRIEEARRLSEERYALAMEATGEGHWDWNIATDESYVSPRHVEIAGLPPDARLASREEFLAQYPFHPEDRAKFEAARQAHYAGKASRLDLELRILPRGELRWVHMIAMCLRDAAGQPVRWAGSATDITERKRAEDARRLSEERYALAMKASEEGHFDWNVQTDEIFASAHLKKVLDLAADAEYRTRGDMVAHIPFYPGDRERIGEMTRDVLAGGALHNEFEYRLLRGQAQEPRWIRARWKIFRDADGVAKRVIGVVSDITERKLAADGLRESEARFRTLTELSSDWYWEQDENLRFTYLSNQAQSLTGYSGESSLGKTRWEIANMTPLSCTWAEHQAVLAARQPFRDLECRRVGPDGTVRYLSMSGAPVFDEQGRFKGYQGIGRNITERKRIDEALRQSEERFALSVAGSNEGIFDWDLVTDRMYMSQRAQELFGLPPGELWRSRPEWRSLVTVHPDDARPLRQVLSAHIAGEAPYDAEFRVCMPDGSIRWFRQRGIALRDGSGKAYRMVGSIGDVTGKHEAEEELSRLERQLRLAQRLEAMGTLAGGIAHDFNNILGAILGFSEMAWRDAPKGSRLQRDLESIATAGERGRALIDRILAFSRSAVGERVAVHVEKVVREALDLLSAKLPPSVSLRAQLRAGRAAMLGDPTQVYQVLMNLGTNAVQAMPSGGTLSVSLDAVRCEAARAATIGKVAAGDYVVLRVADRGSGIAPEILERIFDPFFTTKEAGTGTGLGLSLVHGIVAELGGAIDVESTPSEGTAFTVHLPRSGDALDSSQKEEAELPRGEGQRVLVVDDEEPLVRLATRTLEDLGYRPVGFTSSAAALAAFCADPARFDALIADERMPGLSGTALIREVRGLRRAIPILLMSGYIGGAVASLAREAGADDVLKKPLLARDLATSLARVLQA